MADNKMMGMIGAVVIFDAQSVGAPTDASSFLPNDWMQKIKPPEGMTIQWVRSHLMGELDLANIRKRLDNGWTFVEPADYPDCPAAPIEKAIETGGLILMQKPTERVQYDLAVERQEQVDKDPRAAKIVEEARGFIRDSMKYRGFSDWDITLFLGRHWK